MTEQKKKRVNNKVLEDWMIDLAILWYDVEGLTYREVVNRLVAFFGEQVKVSVQAVEVRIRRRRDQYAKGIAVKNELHNPADLTDKELLDWYRYILYSQIYTAQAGNKPAEVRRAIETALKVHKAKHSVAQSDEDDQKAMQKLLDQIQGKKTDKKQPQVLN